MLPKESTPKNKMNEDVETLKMNTNEAMKSNKCNQCDYVSSRADSLRTHLKTHSGEKSNKCNQCDYASSYASALRAHTVEKSQTNATCVIMHPLGQAV